MRLPRLAGPQVRSDLVLHRLLDRVDLFQPIDVLINLLGTSPDVSGTGPLLILQQQEIGILSCHDEGEGEPNIIGVPERVSHLADVLGRLLHGTSLLQLGRPAMVLLDLLGQMIEHLCDRLELGLC